MISICFFPSQLGTCGLAWTSRGLSALQLPEDGEQLLRKRLRDKCPSRPSEAAPPPPIASAVQRVQQHLQGQLDSLLDLPLDLEELTPFARAVYTRARLTPPGQTTTYTELARLAGRPGAARAVGQAMAHNPLPLLVPCHRVLAAGGGLGGFSAAGREGLKLRLLTLEGADLSPIARAGVAHLRRADPVLARVIRRVGPYRLSGELREDRFTALAEAIVHQQVSMAAGATIFRRLRETAHGASTLNPHHLLATPGDRLREAGLSRQKVSYLLDLAERCVSGALPLHELDRLDDEEIIRLLTQVKGIGRWSAEMFLMFRLGRLNVLPVADLGLRKGAQRVYHLRQLPDPSTLRRLASRWQPFASIATWYLWRSLDAGGL